MRWNINSLVQSQSRKSSSSFFCSNVPCEAPYSWLKHEVVCKYFFLSVTDLSKDFRLKATFNHTFTQSFISCTCIIQSTSYLQLITNHLFTLIYTCNQYYSCKKVKFLLFIWRLHYMMCGQFQFKWINGKLRGSLGGSLWLSSTDLSIRKFHVALNISWYSFPKMSYKSL